MATDALLSFNTAAGASDSFTASGQTSAVTIPGVQRSHALYIRVRYDATTTASSGTNTVQFKAQAYDPSPLTGSAGFYNHTVNDNKVITASNAGPQIGELYLPVSTGLKQVRLAYTVVGTVTVNFIADLVNSNV